MPRPTDCLLLPCAHSCIRGLAHRSRGARPESALARPRRGPSNLVLERRRGAAAKDVPGAVSAERAPPSALAGASFEALAAQERLRTRRSEALRSADANGESIESTEDGPATRRRRRCGWPASVAFGLDRKTVVGRVQCGAGALGRGRTESERTPWAP